MKTVDAKVYVYESNRMPVGENSLSELSPFVYTKHSAETRFVQVDTFIPKLV